ncbi:MAG: glucokinase, partial [Deltaproteobacteria bacterium]|nr:glucokinase [Deltaproteobacteria bacterium]
MEIELVSADIGGTHARFAIATVQSGRVVGLTEPVTLATADHASLQIAWQAFAAARPALP